MTISNTYAFTYNNPQLHLVEGGDVWSNPQLYLDLFKSLPQLTSVGRRVHVRYVIFQRETACSTGTQHFQGYVELTNRCSIRQLQSEWSKVFGQGQHLEATRSGREANVAYCTKVYCGKDTCPPFHTTAVDPGVKYEWVNDATSQVPLSRNESIVVEINDHISKGESWLALNLMEGGRFANTISTRMPYFDRIRAVYCKRPSDIVPYVVVCTGRPGLGKTQYCRRWLKARGRFASDPLKKHCAEGATEGFADEEIYESNVEKGWWTGYDGQPGVIISEFRSSMTVRQLLSLTDEGGNPSVEIKGSCVPFNGRTIMINSNRQIRDFYDVETNSHWLMQDFPAFARRVTECFNFDISYVDEQRWVDETGGDFKEKWRFATIYQLRFDHQTREFLQHRSFSAPEFWTGLI